MTTIFRHFPQPTRKCEWLLVHYPSGETWSDPERRIKNRSSIWDCKQTWIGNDFSQRIFDRDDFLLAVKPVSPTSRQTLFMQIVSRFFPILVVIKMPSIKLTSFLMNLMQVLGLTRRRLGRSRYWSAYRYDLDRDSKGDSTNLKTPQSDHIWNNGNCLSSTTASESFFHHEKDRLCVTASLGQRNNQSQQ